MSYDYHIQWRDPEDFPGTALQNATERCRVYSCMHEGVFSVFPEPEGSKWIYYTMRGSFSPFDKQIVSYCGGKKIFPIV